jgi:hypothetical protein
MLLILEKHFYDSFKSTKFMHMYLYNKNHAYLCLNKKKRFIYISFPTHTNDNAFFTVHSNDQTMLRIRLEVVNKKYYQKKNPMNKFEIKIVNLGEFTKRRNTNRNKNV